MYEFSAFGLLRKLSRLLFLCAHLPFIVAVLWVIGLCYCRPICLLPFLPFLAFLIWRTKRGGALHMRCWIALFCVAEAVLFYFLTAPDEDQFQWGTARLPVIMQNGQDTLHITNIRDFTYRSEQDVDIRYLEEDFDLRELTGVYLAQSCDKDGQFDIMLSFAFRDGRYLVVSPEARIPAGKEFNIVRAHYKGYGLAYIFGTEEDLFLLRSDVNKQPLRLFLLKATPQQAKQMLMYCAGLAGDAAQHNRAYTPLTATYANKLTNVIRIICPELPAYGLSVNNLAEELYHHQLIVTDIRGNRAAAKDTFAVGTDVASERENYSDTIRRRLSLPLRASIPRRRVQEEILASSPTSNGAQPIPAESHAEQHSALTHAEDIPELGERLENDRRREAEQQQAAETDNEDEAPSDAPSEAPEGEESIAETARKLDEQAPLLPVRGGILEAEDRMRSDDRREAEEDERLQESRKRAAEGHDIMEDIDKKKDSDSNFNELFFGKRKSGITIIERKKPKAKHSPLDPARKHKSRNPFDDEQSDPEPQEQQEADPFAPKKPIKI